MQTTNHASQSEVSILARVLGNDDGNLPITMARYILNLGFSEQDKARMHDLAVRNQEDALAPGEKEELFAYSKAGTLLAILKSKARRALKIRAKKRISYLRRAWMQHSCGKSGGELPAA